MVSLGFTMTPVGKHPWGTSTSLAMFDGCLVELMGIYDDALIDEVPAGDFRFGRHVFEHLQVREGVALTALHSTNSIADAEQAQSVGFNVAGHLEFGRDVVLPDGRQDRTKTTLALLPDQTWPRLSFFLCQQHRPELIYVPEWLEHPNGVHGIAGMTIKAGDQDLEKVCKKLAGLYNESSLIEGVYTFTTANGDIRVMSPQAIESEFGHLPSPILAETSPCIVSMDLRYSDETTLKKWLDRSGQSYEQRDRIFYLNKKIRTITIPLGPAEIWQTPQTPNYESLGP